MTLLERIKLGVKIFSLSEDQAIYTCFKNGIPLTDENLADVIQIIQNKAKNQQIESLKANHKQ
jgi:hypothetical protein